MQVHEVMWSDVAPDPNQPRKFFDPEHLEAIELTFRQRGQLQPAWVRKATDGPAKYTLVDGECRWRVGSKLHEAEPDNPLFKTFRVLVQDVADDDTLIVQYLANSGANHTPTEKVEILNRLLERGVPKNKLRSTLGITKGQYRFLKEFLGAPRWLHPYGAPKALAIPVLDANRVPERDDDGNLVRRVETLDPLPLTHLAVLARAASQLIKWDADQQAARPDGEHINLAKSTVTRIADSAIRDRWPVSRLQITVDKALARILEASAAKPKQPPAPFVRTKTGGLSIPQLDPGKLEPHAVGILIQELEAVIDQLRSTTSDSPMPPLAGSSADPLVSTVVRHSEATNV